ncbi:hypothetical protein BDR26DRAFT_1014034 [Obelidium mucronatum]|nr:hypothetical protein BDR26DRAFT_1014034 [Obelidium mucronatum]
MNDLPQIQANTREALAKGKRAHALALANALVAGSASASTRPQGGVTGQATQAVKGGRASLRIFGENIPLGRIPSRIVEISRGTTSAISATRNIPLEETPNHDLAENPFSASPEYGGKCLAIAVNYQNFIAVNQKAMKHAQVKLAFLCSYMCLVTSDEYMWNTIKTTHPQYMAYRAMCKKTFQFTGMPATEDAEGKFRQVVTAGIAVAETGWFMQAHLDGLDPRNIEPDDFTMKLFNAFTEIMPSIAIYTVAVASKSIKDECDSNQVDGIVLRRMLEHKQGKTPPILHKEDTPKNLEDDEMNTSKPANGSEPIDSPECDAGPCLNASNPPAHPPNAQPETLGFAPGDNDSTSGATPQPPAPTTDQQRKPTPEGQVPTPQQTTPASPAPPEPTPTTTAATPSQIPHAPPPVLIAPRSDGQQASGTPEGPLTPTRPKRRKSQISAPASSDSEPCQSSKKRKGRKRASKPSPSKLIATNQQFFTEAFEGTFKNDAGDDFIEIKTETKPIFVKTEHCEAAEYFLRYGHLTMNEFRKQAAATGYAKQLGQLYADIFKRAVLSNEFISDSSEDEVKVNVVKQAGLNTMSSSIVKDVSIGRNANVAGDDPMVLDNSQSEAREHKGKTGDFQKEGGVPMDMEFDNWWGGNMDLPSTDPQSATQPPGVYTPHWIQEVFIGMPIEILVPDGNQLSWQLAKVVGSTSHLGMVQTVEVQVDGNNQTNLKIIDTSDPSQLICLRQCGG